METAHQTISAAASTTDWLYSYGWPLLLLFMLFVIFLYVWSYLNKNLERLSARESEYVDADVAIYLGRMAKASMAMILLFILAFVLAQLWTDFMELVWEPYLTVFVQLAIILIVLLFAGLLVRLLRNLSRRSRRGATSGKALRGSLIELTSLLLSYVIYIGAAIVVLVLLFTYISDVDVWSSLMNFWEENGVKLETLVIFLVAVLIFIRVINAIFEDFKFRTKKFNPQVIDLLKSLVRYVLYLIAFMITVFILFSVMDLEEVGIILIVTILVFITLAIALSYSTVKNIVSGLAIMNTEIFVVGDQIRIGRDLVCEVVEKNLIFTRVRTEDGETVNVPNSEIMAAKVLNYNRSLAHGITVSFELPIEIAHSDVEAMVRRAVMTVEGLMKEPAPQVFAREIQGDRMMYEVSGYVLDALKAKRIRSNLILSIQDAAAADERLSFNRHPSGKAA